MTHPMLRALVAGAKKPRTFGFKADGAWLHQSNFEATCYAGFKLDTDGSLYSIGPDFVDESLEGTFESSGDATDLYVRVTDNSANLSGDTEGSFIALSSARSWYVVDSSTAGGPVVGDCDVDLATDAGGTNIVATVNWTPSALDTA